MLTIGNAISVNNFSYAGSDGFNYAVNYLYPIDINNDGIKELIFAGFETQPNTPANFTPSQVNIFSWQAGNLVNITNQWLPNNTNIVDGVADVTYGDFNGDGLTDIYLSGYSDMNYQINSYELINQGSSFKKISLGSTEWEHGVTSGDINNDGYTDVIVAGYIHPSPIYLGGPNGLIKTEVVDSAQNLSWDLNASGVAFGNFLVDGSKSIIVVDGGSRNGGTNLFKINSTNGAVTIDYVSSLPQPLLGDASHDIRARTMDFNNDGFDDVIVFSRESYNGNIWPVNSRIQFYVNKGSGNFEDVTAKKLIGYDTNSNVDYNPIFADFNGDGLTDIFTSEASFGVPSNSTAILMQQPNGTFVDSYRKELSALVNPKGGIATILQGQDKSWYLASAYQLKGGETSLTLYKLNFNNYPTGIVTISGTINQGQTLNAINTLADADGLGTIAYQWLRDGAIINNAIYSTYPLTQADVGKAISVKANYTDLLGTAESVTSAPTSAVTSTGTQVTSITKVLLGFGDTFVAASNVAIFGNSGSETVKVQDGVAVTLDGNIERVEFAQPSSSYTYQATPTGIDVLLSGNRAASVVNGEKLAFTNGSAMVAVTFTPQGLGFTLGGSSVSTTAGVVAFSPNNSIGEASTLIAATPVSVTLNANSTSVTATSAVDIFNIALGSYKATIADFKPGDKLKFFAGALIVFINDNNQGDGYQEISATDPNTGATAIIALTGLTSAQDDGAFNVPGFNNVFGSGSLV